MRNKRSKFIIVLLSALAMLISMSVVAFAATDSGDTAFSQSKKVDGVTVAVKADAGVFPADAALSVSKTNVPKAVNAADTVGTYAFDISILDAAGNELQPNGQADVSFTTEEVADAGLTTNVYHMAGKTAEEMAVKEKGKTATVTTDSFSTYVLTFTYGENDPFKYVMKSDGKVYLSTIAKALGIEGYTSDGYATIQYAETESTDKNILEVGHDDDEDGLYWVKAKANGTANLVFAYYCTQIYSEDHPVDHKTGVWYYNTVSVSVVDADGDGEIVKPVANNRVYDGNSAPLFTAGSVDPSVGIMQYMIKGEWKEISGSARIPEETDAGTYPVSWRVVPDANSNTVIASESFDVIIKKANNPVTIKAKTLSYTGDPQELLEVSGNLGGDNALAIKYTMKNGDTSTIIPQRTEVGKYSIQCEVAGNNNYKKADPITVIAEITEAKLVFNPPTAANPTYNGKEQGLVKEGSVSKGFVVKYSVNGGDYNETLPIGISADKYTVAYRIFKGKKAIDPEAYVITDSAGNPVEYPNQFTARIRPLEAELVWSNDLLTYTGELLGPTARVNNVVTKEEREEPDKVKVIVNGKAVEAGEHIAIAAALTGQDAGNYKLPENATKTFTIDPATINSATIDEETSWNFGEEPKLPAVTIDPADKQFNVVLFYKKESSTEWTRWANDPPTNVGVYDVRALVKDREGNYKDTYTNPGKVKINEANVPPKVYIAGWTFGDDPNEPVFENRSAYADEGLTLLYEYKKDITGDWKEYDTNKEGYYPTEVGTYILKLTVSSANYSEASGETKFTITEADQNVRKPVAATELVYDGGMQKLLKNPGKADHGTLYYYVASDGLDPDFYNDDGEIKDGWSKEVPEGKDAKTYCIWYAVDAEDGYQSIVAGPILPKIEPKTVSVTWNEKTSFTYDGTALRPTAKVTEGDDGDGRIASDELRVKVRVEGYNANDEQYEDGECINVGTYKAHASLVRRAKDGEDWVLDTNYEIAKEFEHIPFSITPAEVTVTAKSYEVTYGLTNNPVEIPGCTYEGFVGRDASKYLSGDVAIEVPGWPLYVGTYKIKKGTLKILPSDSGQANYTMKFVPGTLTINPAKLTVEVKTGKTKTYGDPDPVFPYEIDDNNWKYEDKTAGYLTGKLSREPGEDVGKYAITRGSLDIVEKENALGQPVKNYDIEFVSNNKKLTIEKKPAYITWSNDGDETCVYNGKEHYVYATITGAVEGESLVPHYTDNSVHAATDAGNYTGIVDGVLGETSATKPGNYQLYEGTIPIPTEQNPSSTRNWTIEKKPAYLTWNNDGDEACVYNGKEHYVYAAITGAVKGESLVPHYNSNSVHAATDAGTYKGIVDGMLGGTVDPAVESATKPANYRLYEGTTEILTEEHPTSWTEWKVAKADVTVKADDKRKAIGTNDPELTYSITSGKVYGQDKLNVTLSRAGGETEGTYVITPMAGDNKNYNVACETGIFTIYTPSPGPGPGPTPVVDPVQHVIDLINALPNQATIKDEAQVQAARDAYNALTPEQQAKVTNYQKLVDAEAQVKTAEDQKVADEVSALIIDKLPPNPADADPAVAQAVFDAYSKLTDAQKALLSKEAQDRVAAYKYYYEVQYAKAKTVKSFKVKNIKTKKAKCTWAATDNVDGYQIIYKAKGVKAKKVYAKASATKKIVKKLKKDKKYTFKICTYNEIYNPTSGAVEKVFGKTSTKKVKIKK